MKTFKKFLKYWISLVSMLGFLVGWRFVSQSSETDFARQSTGSTVTTQSQTVVLAPIPSLDSLVGGSAQPLTQTQVQSFKVVQSQSFQPQLRIGGS